MARHQVVASEAETFPNPTSFIGYLAWVGSRRLEVLSERFEARIDDLEELAMGADPRTIIETHALRRDVVVLRRVLGPHRGVFDELSEMMHPLSAGTRQSSSVGWRISSLGSSRPPKRDESLLGSVVDTYRGAVAGIWGMNFDGLPAADDPRGFWILVSVMALLAFGLWLYFARRGFVGDPRLRNPPKAVGLGLVHIGTAPIRAGDRRRRDDPADGRSHRRSRAETTRTTLLTLPDRDLATTTTTNAHNTAEPAS